MHTHVLMENQPQLYISFVAAAALGYRQRVFSPKPCTYHIDHSSGWESMSLMEKLKFLEERPGIDYGMLYEADMYILELKNV